MSPSSTCQVPPGPSVPGLNVSSSLLYSPWTTGTSSSFGTTIHFNTGYSIFALSTHWSFFPSRMWIPLESAISYLPLFPQGMAHTKVLPKMSSENEWVKKYKSTLEIFLILKDHMQRKLVLWILGNNISLPKLSFTNNSTVSRSLI